MLYQCIAFAVLSPAIVAAFAVYHHTHVKGHQRDSVSR